MTFVALALVSCATHRVALTTQAPATIALEPPGYEKAVVDDVIDGDTIKVTVVGKADGPGAGEARVGAAYTVRLLGIDTPESVDPRRAVECFGREASAATAALLRGRTVLMVKDMEEVDSFGRLLRYVYLGAEMANARLVVNGYANAYTYPPNVRHASLFVDLQRRARQAARGLWSPETCGGDAQTAPSPIFHKPVAFES
jgi:micrococcal nuclease